MEFNLNAMVNCFIVRNKRSYFAFYLRNQFVKQIERKSFES